MNNNIDIRVVQKPHRKVILKRGVKAADYFAYCEEVGCDVWDILVKMPSLCGEPVSMWLPEKFRDGGSEYVQGVEVPVDYDGQIPEGFDVIELPEAEYLLFHGAPFQDEEFAEAIGEVWRAAKEYDPSVLGYQWDAENPRIQMEPTGARGYMEYYPVRKC